MKTLRFALCFAALMQCGCMTSRVMQVAGGHDGAPPVPALNVLLIATVPLDLVTLPFQLVGIAFMLDRQGL